MDEKILEEKKQFLLYYCKLYQDYGREISETDNFESVKFFIFGLCNRALALNSGFYDLTTAKCENYLAAIPLIRLMLDNAMTGYAFFMAGDTFDDRLKYIQHIRKGKEIRKFRIDHNKTLMEKFIINEMNHEIKGIRSLYKKGSSYIHYSSNLLNASVSRSGNELFMNVNYTAGFYTEEERIEFWDDMIGANIYMTYVLGKMQTYIEETIIPIIERTIEQNKETIERLMKEKGINLP